MSREQLGGKLREAAEQYVFSLPELQKRNADLTGVDIENAYLAGARWMAERAVSILRDQCEGCQPGTLVSYHIAAEVLAVELRTLAGKDADEQA